MNTPAVSPRRRFFRGIVVFAVLHYVILLCLGFVIFVLSHLPTRAVNFDPAIIALVRVENVLVAPKSLMLWLWPFERTPGGLGSILTVLNSLLWGVALALFRLFWRRATT